MEATATTVKHAPWVLAAFVALTVFAGLADVPGLLAPEAFAPTSYACAAAVQPLSAVLAFGGMVALLGLAIWGLVRGGPFRLALVAFFASTGVIALSIAANTNAESRIARASLAALDKDVSAGATEQDVLRAILRANLAIAGRDEAYREALGAAITSSVTPASFEIPSDYRCVFRPREPGRFTRRFDVKDGSTMYEVRYVIEGGRAVRVDHERYIDAERGAHNRVVTSLID